MWIGPTRIASCLDCSSLRFTTAEKCDICRQGGECEICRQGWEWLDGKPYEYQNWKSHEPDGGTDAVIDRDGGWYDASFTLVRAYICKQTGAYLFS